MKKFIKSLGFAWEGIRYATKTQRNFKIHLTVGSVAIISGLIFKINSIEWVLLILTITAVLVAELANTIVETIMDFVSPDFNGIVKIVKDLSAGAVLLTAIASIIVGLIIFMPKLLDILLLF